MLLHCRLLNSRGLFAAGGRCIALVVAVALVASTASAFPINSSDDTWVREDNSDSNRDGNDQMNLRTDIDGDDNDVILLRFPLTELTGPAPGASTLRLFWQRTTGDSEGKIMKVYGLNETDPDETTWMDDTVVYDDAPGLIPDGGGDNTVNNAMTEFNDGHTEADIYDLDEANTTFIGEMVMPPAVQNDPLDFVSTALTDFINADTNDEVTLLLFRDQTTSGHQLRFWPREHISDLGFPEYQPQLLIAPEPASLALLGLSSLALCVVRRRLS